ncbi:GIY-YIG nuclease family protein [Stigmatella aurantiaca]|nr:GIY-YIG nuclease family protein [Stigmatella aurantiaca]
MVVIMAVLIFALTIALTVFQTRARSANALLQQAREETGSLQERVSKLEADNKVLEQYRRIPNAEQHAQEIIQAAERRAEEVQARAQENQERMLAAVLAENERTRAALQTDRDRATAEFQVTKNKASAILTDAAAEASAVVETAYKRARELEAESSLTVQTIEELKRTIEALKNVIEGYGNQYVIPTYGLLDELAEEFGHAESGQRLKSARDSMRRMIKSGTAATCDYVEESRKSTAIDFVLDAFNGKVDTILLSLKSDNHGTLAQKIRDAFNIVNNNGKAFRNARITPEYLQVRLDELHWAAVTQELKEKEREEQRILKERIREEEKAQREYERAMKEAQKEEEVLRKAMEKAQREIEKASDEQKARYEDQLRELQERLKSAEEKNQRALSMAQQTKTGHVYVISNIGSFGEDVYKIGLTRRLEPLDRIKELGDASVPFEFDVHSLISSEDAPALERELHKRFVRTQVNKVNPRKEFFRLTLQDIRRELEGMGIHAKWTLAAECREYKETRAIEQAMVDKTFHESAWMEKQLQEQDADPQRLAG